MRFWLLLLPLALLLSCAVQKRKYQKGFYFSGKHVAKKSNTGPARQASSGHKKVIAEEVSELPEQELSASAGKGTDMPTSFPPRKTVLVQNTDTCDKIVFRDGTELMAKILEVSQDEIRYKKCEMPEGPFFVSRKTDIFMISYANGSKEVFREPVAQAAPAPRASYPTIPRYADPDKVRADAVTALVLGITGLFLYVGSIPAIVLGRRVLKEVQQNPQKYKNTGVEGMARAGLVMGIIKWAIVIIVILLSLSLLFAQ